MQLQADYNITLSEKTFVQNDVERSLVIDESYNWEVMFWWMFVDTKFDFVNQFSSFIFGLSECVQLAAYV